MEAVNKIKQTAQYYSQSPKIYNDWKDSIAGGVFGSFLRFRLETRRITTNSFMLAKKERASENPIIKSRGTLRLKGAATNVCYHVFIRHNDGKNILSRSISPYRTYPCRWT